MNEQLSKHYYNQLLNSNEQELKKYKVVNGYLKLNDWLFISPIFFQGYELDCFLELSKNNNDEKAKILEIIYRKFYDLRHTASFIEGYCVRCNYIKPFLKSIENSLILVYQKDYEGSIKTIIPIIEGILRKYLISEKNYRTETVRPKDLKNSFDYIKIDIIENYRKYLKTYRTENNIAVHFSNLQIENLIKKEEEYFNIWFSFVSDFVRNSFYLNTSGKPLTNEVNRHSILHEFGLNFEYNLENFIKIYFLLQFLTWAFLRKEGKSVLNKIESYRYFEKIVAYERIIKLSDKLLYEKHILLKNYNDYEDSILKQKFPEFRNDILPRKHLFVHKILRKFDQFLWRKNLKPSL